MLNKQQSPAVCESVSLPVVSDSLLPHGLQPARVLCPWGSPGKNTGVGCYSLFQGIFPTWGLNPGLLHQRQILYHLSHQGSPTYCIAQGIIFNILLESHNGKEYEKKKEKEKRESQINLVENLQLVDLSRPAQAAGQGWPPHIGNQMPKLSRRVKVLKTNNTVLLRDVESGKEVEDRTQDQSRWTKVRILPLSLIAGCA